MVCRTLGSGHYELFFFDLILLNLIIWFYQCYSDCTTTNIYPYKSVFFKIQADTIPICFGIINECRVDHHAKPSRGVSLFFGMLPTYKPSHYVEPLFGTYQIIIQHQFLAQFMVLNGHILRNSTKIWTIIMVCLWEGYCLNL